jgi:hypothetical protein
MSAIRGNFDHPKTITLTSIRELRAELEADAGPLARKVLDALDLFVVDLDRASSSCDAACDFYWKSSPSEPYAANYQDGHADAYALIALNMRDPAQLQALAETHEPDDVEAVD